MSKKKVVKNDNSKTSSSSAIKNFDSMTTIAKIECNDEPMVEIPEEVSEVVIADNKISEAILDELALVVESSIANIENPELVADVEKVAVNYDEVELTDLITGSVEVITEYNQPVIEGELPVPEVKATKTGKNTENKIDISGSERVKLVGTSYHYFRNWLKKALRAGEITTAKFIKNETGWNGHITIPAIDKEAAMKILEQYSKDNTKIKDLYWDVTIAK